MGQRILGWNRDARRSHEAEGENTLARTAHLDAIRLEAHRNVRREGGAIERDLNCGLHRYHPRTGRLEAEGQASRHDLPHRGIDSRWELHIGWGEIDYDRVRRIGGKLSTNDRRAREDIVRP